MTLEEAIRDLDRRGKFESLSIWRTESGRYQANLKNGRNSYAVEIRNDPINALLVVTGAVDHLEMNRRERAAEADFEDLLG